MFWGQGRFVFLCVFFMSFFVSFVSPAEKCLFLSTRAHPEKAHVEVESYTVVCFVRKEVSYPASLVEKTHASSLSCTRWSALFAVIRLAGWPGRAALYVVSTKGSRSHEGAERAGAVMTKIKYLELFCTKKKKRKTKNHLFFVSQPVFLFFFPFFFLEKKKLSHMRENIPFDGFAGAW